MESHARGIVREDRRSSTGAQRPPLGGTSRSGMSERLLAGAAAGKGTARVASYQERSHVRSSRSPAQCLRIIYIL
eukprot:scaffold57833_cov57-Phaeocystis_antarctica.AAC.3